MSNFVNIELVEYEGRYAEAAVRMWRDSKERAIGVKERYSFEDHLEFLTEILVKDNAVYLALIQNNDKVVGLMATDNEFVNQLYIHNDYQRIGIGSRLLALAKANSCGNLRLFTFEVNRGAQAFYEKHGFRIIEHGSDNEEGLPDILYEWNKDH